VNAVTAASARIVTARMSLRMTLSCQMGISNRVVGSCKRHMSIDVPGQLLCREPVTTCGIPARRGSHESMGHADTPVKVPIKAQPEPGKAPVRIASLVFVSLGDLRSGGPTPNPCQ